MSHIALEKTFKYKIKHAISFHQSIAKAKDFKNLQNTFFSGKIFPEINISAPHISSKNNASERSFYQPLSKKIIL